MALGAYGGEHGKEPEKSPDVSPTRRHGGEGVMGGGGRDWLGELGAADGEFAQEVGVSPT